MTKTFDKTKYFKIIDDGKLTTSEIMEQMKKKFNVWNYYDKEKLDKDFPSPKQPTTRYFLKEVEADEEHKNKSAKNLEKEGVEGITLRERLIMELQYFEETGKHLDVDNVTLCSGSRFSGGGVPSVGWSADARRVYVDWDSVSDSHSGLRARAVVSLNPDSSAILEPFAIDEAIEVVKKAGYSVIKKTWFITGQGDIMEFGNNNKLEGRKAFLGSYATKEDAQKVADEIRGRYGDK